MQINKDKLDAIAVPLSHRRKNGMQSRRQDRRMHSASSAIAAKILREMRITGKSKSQLARDLGITAANVTRYLSGKCNFELRTLVEIEHLLDIRIIDRDIIPSEKQENVLLIQIKKSSPDDREFIIGPETTGSYYYG